MDDPLALRPADRAASAGRSTGCRVAGAAAPVAMLPPGSRGGEAVALAQRLRAQAGALVTAAFSTRCLGRHGGNRAVSGPCRAPGASVSEGCGAVPGRHGQGRCTPQHLTRVVDDRPIGVRQGFGRFQDGISPRRSEIVVPPSTSSQSPSIFDITKQRELFRGPKFCRGVGGLTSCRRLRRGRPIIGTQGPEIKRVADMFRHRPAALRRKYTIRKSASSARPQPAGGTDAEGMTTGMMIRPCSVPVRPDSRFGNATLRGQPSYGSKRKQMGHQNGNGAVAPPRHLYP